MIKYNHKLKVIKDPVYGNIPLSYVDSLILSSTVFNRLHNIRQNGVAYMVYPGAITTRFLHSVGVMHLATECFIHAIHNAPIHYLKSFLERLRDEIKDILDTQINYIVDVISSNLEKNLKEKFETIAKRVGNYVKALYNIFYNNNTLSDVRDQDIIFLMFIDSILNYSEKDAFFSLYNLSPQIKEKLDDKELYSLALFSLLSVRLAGLLHDVGHLPFSHCLEDIIEHIYDNLEKKFDDKDSNNIFDKNERKIEDSVLFKLKELLSPYCKSGGLKIHEIVGLKIINIIFYDLINKIKISNFNDLSTQFVLISLQLVVPKILHPYSEQDDKDFVAISALKNIISSGVDVDRLDFCIRDNTFSGLDSGRCDIERIIRFMTLVKESRSEGDQVIEGYYILPSLRTLNTVEDLLICRLNIYKHLCCHHKIIRLGRILKEIIKELLIYELSEDSTENRKKLITEDTPTISLEDLHSISIIFYFLKKIGHINNPTDLKSIGSVKHVLYIFSQLDEPWLMSVLRRYYHEKITEIQQLEPFFEDLFGNSKNFRSLWKRFYQYKKEFINLLSDNLNNIEDIIRELTDKKKGHWVKKIEENIEDGGKYILIEPVKDKFGKGGLDSIYLYDAEKDKILSLADVKRNLVEYIENEYYYEIPDFFVFYDTHQYSSKNKLDDLKQSLKEVALNVIISKSEGGGSNV